MTLNTLVLASGNAGKLREFSQLMEAWPVTVKPQSDYNLNSADETGVTFIENALIKARHAAQQTGLAAVADDSGLVVPALNGEPGIYSSRYAGADASDTDNIEKLLEAMTDIQERKAHFQCVLVFIKHADDPVPIIAQGQWHGEIAQTPLGDGGFGYDPIFYLPEHQCSAAQLDKSVKNRISHRGQAMREIQRSMAGLFV